LNQPIADLDDVALAAEIERNYPWNFTVNLLDGAFFWFGASFISSATILPLFLSKLTSNPFWFGLLAVIAQGGWFIPQLFTANLLERLARQKPVVVNAGLILERLPLLVMVASAAVAGRAPNLALVLLFVGYAWHGFGAGAVGASWQDLIARCFPVDRRGRFFGTTMFVGNGAGAAGAALSAWMLVVYPFPINFVYAFGIAAISIALSWCAIALTRETAQRPKGTRRSNQEFLAELPALVRQDHNYRRFLISRLLLALGGMGIGFLTVSAVQRWHVSDGTVGIYTATLLIGQTAGNLVFGFVADKRGHKICLEIGIIAGFLGFALACLAPAPSVYYAVFALLGVTASAIMVSGLLIVMEFCQPERRPTYIGITSTSVGLVSALAPLMGAALAELGYGWVFAASALFELAALATMRWWVRDPRWATTQAGPGSKER
jgi:MFS family permease